MHYFTWSLDSKAFISVVFWQRSKGKVISESCGPRQLKGLAPKVCSCCDQLCVRHVWPFSWAFLPALWCFAQHCGPLIVDSGSGNKVGLAFSLLPSLFVASATGVSHLILSGLCSECLRPFPWFICWTPGEETCKKVVEVKRGQLLGSGPALAGSDTQKLVSVASILGEHYGSVMVERRTHRYWSGSSCMILDLFFLIRRKKLLLSWSKQMELQRMVWLISLHTVFTTSGPLSAFLPALRPGDICHRQWSYVCVFMVVFCVLPYRM